MDWATRLMEALGYPGIALAVLLENLFPPIPSEVILPFAGFMATQGAVNLPGVIAASTAGSAAGAVALYFLGALVGRERLFHIVERYQRILAVTPDHLRQAEEWFARYGGYTVFFCRMVPIMRSLISIPAGLVRMRLPTFLLYTSLGALIWNSVLVGFGALLGSSWPLVTRWAGYYQDLVLIACGVLAAALLVAAWRRRRTGRP